MKAALETGEGLWGTVEFFPEEGKYHLDGHRACGVRLSPQETRALQGKCPVCGKRLTIGVEHRVEDLACRQPGSSRENRKPFVKLVPLATVLSTCLGRGEQTKTVQAAYERLLSQLGTEFAILREAPVETIAAVAGEPVAQGISLLRQGKAAWQPGFDGVYGTLSLEPEPEEPLPR